MAIRQSFGAKSIVTTDHYGKCDPAEFGLADITMRRSGGTAMRRVLREATIFVWDIWIEALCCAAF
jgi:hypothetical protein